MPRKIIFRIFSFISFFFFFNLGFSQIEILPIADRKLSLGGDRISQGRVKSLIEDNKGVMWIGTLDGLNSFDGYNAIVYRHKSNDSTTISNNIINSLIKDDKGFLWIGTNNGLNKLSTESKIFERFIEKSQDLNGQDANVINKLTIDRNNFVWMATNGAGVVRFDPITKERVYVSIDLDIGNSLNQKMIHIEVDAFNNIWFTNTSGIVGRINSELNNIEYFSFSGRESTTSKTHWINSIYRDINNKIWFSLTGLYEGLYYFDSISNSLIEERRINNQLRNNQHISSLRSVSSIINDRDGNIWFCSTYLGVYKVDKDFKIKCYPDNPFHDLTTYSELSEVGGLELYWGSTDILWIGTNGYGLEYIPDFNFSFKTVKQNGQNRNFNIRSVRAFEEDETSIWISGYFNLTRFDKKTKKYSSLIPGGSYYSLCNNPSDSNELFIGTEGGGLGVYNKTTGEFIEERIEKTSSDNSMFGINVYELMGQGDSILWVGRNSGLEKHNLKTNFSEDIEFIYPNWKTSREVSIISSFIDDEDAWFGSLVDGVWMYDKIRNVLISKKLELENGVSQPQRINSIFRDSRNMLLLCTDNGVFRSNDWDETFKLISVDDGLANNFVYASLEDNFGNIWFSTNNGLSKWEVSTNNFTNYLLSSGIQDNEFNTGAFFKDKSGFLYFGGISGYTYFKPEDKQIKHGEFPFILTSATSNLGELEMQFDINGNPILYLKQDVQFLDIEFSLLSFLSEEQNFYQYRNLKVDQDWIDLEKTNRLLLDKPATGTNYVEVRASAMGKDWNDKILKITIIKEPYYWETIWFWLLILILIVLLSFYFVKRKIWKSKAEKHKLSMLVNIKTKEINKKNEELHESNRTKDRLFSIIAHDLRNPLNSLLGFSSLLEAQGDHFSDKEKKEFVSIIYLSSRNLNNLLDNLLNWSRLQLKEIKPSFNVVDIRSVIDSNLNVLASNINQKHLNISLSGLTNAIVNIDQDMVSVIIRNLLSNAIKFTHDGGEINISINREQDFCKVCIKDNGVGMDEKSLSKLFNVDNINTKLGTNKELGTGLGLILCHDFAKLNNGKLTASSTIGEGSSFTLFIRNQ